MMSANGISTGTSVAPRSWNTACAAARPSSTSSSASSRSRPWVRRSSILLHEVFGRRHGQRDRCRRSVITFVIARDDTSKRAQSSAVRASGPTLSSENDSPIVPYRETRVCVGSFEQSTGSRRQSNRAAGVNPSAPNTNRAAVAEPVFTRGTASDISGIPRLDRLRSDGCDP